MINAADLKQILGFYDTSLTLEHSSQTIQDGYVVEHLSFKSAQGDAITGWLTRPLRIEKPCPTILYAHAHGGRYDIGARELLDGRPALQNAPGPHLAQAGYITLCIDMPTFGTRTHLRESAAAKAALWYGRTLFGQMLAEQAGALTWLLGRDDVNPNAIGICGISMGATISYFLAAIDPRIKAVAHLCCYGDFDYLVKTQMHDLHGHYLTIPGLLARTSIGEIAGLIAPRAQLICVGLEDPLTPPDAVHIALEQTKAAYRDAQSENTLFYLGQTRTGHMETAQMRQEWFSFFDNSLTLQ